jgi:hypothetical protein
MKWSVAWIQNAEAELTDLWLRAGNRAELTRAAEAIDVRLADDPVDFGESREADERIAFLGPLAVEFTVDEKQHRVFVFHVRWISKSNRDS